MGKKRPNRKPTQKQRKFLQGIAKGLKPTEAVKLAGYNTKTSNTASVIANQLLKNDLIIKSLDEAGITDDNMAKTLKRHIEDGIGVKSTADTSLRALDLAYKIKMGTMNKTDVTNKQTNVYINELKGLDDKGLMQRLESIEGEIAGLKG